MDMPMYAEYYAQVNNRPMIGEVTRNPYTRQDIDDFYTLQSVRLTDPHDQPHMSYMPPPMDPDTVVAAPAPSSYIDPTLRNHPMPANIREVHDMMQANMLQQDRQRRNQRTRSRRLGAGYY